MFDKTNKEDIAINSDNSKQINVARWVKIGLLRMAEFIVHCVYRIHNIWIVACSKIKYPSFLTSIYGTRLVCNDNIQSILRKKVHRFKRRRTLIFGYYSKTSSYQRNLFTRPILWINIPTSVSSWNLRIYSTHPMVHPNERLQLARVQLHQQRYRKLERDQQLLQSLRRHHPQLLRGEQVR